MGCFCCKATAIEDSRESPRERVSNKLPAANERITVSSSRREEISRPKDFTGNYGNRDGRVVVAFEKQSSGSARVEYAERRREKQAYVHLHHPATGTIPKATEGEQVAAGWPAWLAAVAGEAIRGWVPRRADSFEKLDKIGQGTYSNVYRARDLDNGKIVALKKVRFDNLEPESVRFMAREIHILRRLDHPNIVKLEGLVTSRMSCSLYLVFEYMEHDLAGLASCPGMKFSEPQVKCYMQQLLRGLDHCHSRNILHRDIKGSNLLIDNNGILKIADFGLASFFDPERRHPLTSRVVTLWYRPPELLLGATDYGVAVDLWSTGCILAELYAGKPIMPGRTEVEQLHKIFKLCGSPSEEYWRKSKLPHATIFKPQQPYRRCVGETYKDFPAPALGLMEVLLSIDPVDRETACSALKSEVSLEVIIKRISTFGFGLYMHPSPSPCFTSLRPEFTLPHRFFTTKPLACDPSSLPRYPPSKEFDAKVRDEEARRQVGKMQRFDHERKISRDSRAIPAPEANAELPLSLQRRQSQSNSKSRSEKFCLQQEEIASGFPIDPPRQAHASEQTCEDSQGHFRNRASHSGPLAHRGAWVKARKQEDDALNISGGADLSALSSLVAARRNGSEKVGLSQPEVGRLIESGNDSLESSRKHDRAVYQKEEGRSSDRDPVLLGYGSKGNKIHYSGPLLRPSGNVDQMLKEHDRQIQEVVRRARVDKARTRKGQAEGNRYTSKQYNPSGAIQVLSSGREAAYIDVGKDK